MQNKHIVYWLRFVGFFLFFGRGWQHLVWNGPYSSIYFSERYIGGLVCKLTGQDSFTYLSNPYVSKWYDWINDGIAILFFIAAFSVLLLNKKNSFFKKMVKVGWGLLFLVAIGYYVEKKFVLAQFFEFSAQLAIPYLLLLSVKYKMKGKFLFWAKFSIALTFVCHGLYAIGYYPLPGNFMNMTLNTLSISNEGAELFLKIVGYLDFVFALGLFIPKISKYIVYYGLVWGFLTAFARVFTTFDMDFMQSSLSQNMFEFLVRMPHFIIPLLLIRYKKEIYI